MREGGSVGIAMAVGRVELILYADRREPIGQGAHESTKAMVVHGKPVGDAKRPRLRVGDEPPPRRLGPHPQEGLLDGVVGFVLVQAQPPAFRTVE